MCGLAGFIGLSKPSIDKMKILGLYNISRGRDSCGYFYNNFLQKGVDKVKIFSDLLESDSGIIKDSDNLKSNVFMLHTRAGTAGANTAENAHPHLINDKYVLIHNGTISNIWDLCNKYNIKHAGIQNDSLALGLLLDKVGFSILNEYVGYAAIIWHKLDEPNAVWIYHGASKEWDYNGAELKEERPLFAMAVDDGYYFSSLNGSLLAIRNHDYEIPFQVPVNEVIKVVGNEWGTEIIKVERELNNCASQKKTSTQTPWNGVRSLPPTTTHIPETMRTGISKVLTLFPKEGKIINDKNIKFETFPAIINELEAHAENYLYYHYGRYWTNDKTLANGVLYLGKNGILYETLKDKVYERYFFEGVLIKSKKDYDLIHTAISLKNFLGDALKDKKINNFALLISRYAKYPVTNIVGEAVNCTDLVRDGWYQDGKNASGGITPLFSDRNYTFKNGYLVSVENNLDKTDIIWIDSKKGYHKYINVNNVLDPNKDDLIEADELAINSLLKYFDRTFTSKDEIYADCPSTVINALFNYFKEIYESCGYVQDTISIENQLEYFLNTVVNDRISFLDNMPSEDSKTIRKYVEDAYLDELIDEEEIEDYSPNVETFDGGEVVIKNEQNFVVTEKKNGSKTTISVKPKTS